MADPFGKGITFYLVIGNWSKPKVQLMEATRSIRFCLGFVSFRIGFYDLEVYQRFLATHFLSHDR